MLVEVSAVTVNLIGACDGTAIKLFDEKYNIYLLNFQYIFR